MITATNRLLRNPPFHFAASTVQATTGGGRARDTWLHLGVVAVLDPEGLLWHPPQL